MIEFSLILFCVNVFLTKKSKYNFEISETNDLEIEESFKKFKFHRLPLKILFTIL